MDIFFFFSCFYSIFFGYLFKNFLDHFDVISFLISPVFLQLVIGFDCVSGGVLFGYDVGVISGAKVQVAHEMELSCGQEEALVRQQTVMQTLVWRILSNPDPFLLDSEENISFLKN